MSTAIHAWLRIARICQNQDLQDWRDFQDFIVAQIGIFAITGNFVKTIADDALFVIPAKAGIQMIEANLVARSQA